jgi:phosphoglycolate/pyridoxal phosphate phosphatase family enzyme
MALSQIIEAHDAFFFDLDGVIWECETLLPGVKELIDLLTLNGKRIYYVSNNAIRSLKGFKSWFESMGLPADEKNIICAASSSSTYLKASHQPGSLVYVIGSPGLVESIKEAGFEVVDSNTMKNIKLTTTELGTIQANPMIKAVVVGYTMDLNFYMLSYALNCIKQGAELVTGNYDHVDKFGKYNVPGCACSVDFIRYAMKSEFVNVGKPEPYMVNKLIERDELDVARCVMFGDKMSTDIKVGINAGIHTALVLTGVENEDSYKMYDFGPDYVLQNLVINT